MKIIIGTTVVALLCTTSARAADQTLMGTIGDSLCGATHKDMGRKMTDRECTQACAAKGAQYVLVSDGKVYKLTNHAADLKIHAGHMVNLTGEVKGDTIRVSKIEMPGNTSRSFTSPLMTVLALSGCCVHMTQHRRASAASRSPQLSLLVSSPRTDSAPACEL